MHTRRMFLSALAAPLAFGGVPRSSMGVATTCYMTVRRPRDAYEFLEYCNTLGAGGIQSALPPQATPEYLKKLRLSAEKYGMFLELMSALPRTEKDEAFQKTLENAKAVGALCVRSACLSGRRYETFSTMEDWNRFVAQSRQAMERAVRMAEAAKVPLALENHKDWTADEFAAVLKRYSSEYFGVCLDTGNNMSLLDHPMETVEKLAPYAISTHIKDMAVEEYPDGFLLAEVPFGEGMLDLKKMVATIRGARPKVRFTLEMITRDPLKVPCLTEKYWATFSERSGPRLAMMLRAVRTAKCTKPIPRLSALPAKAQWQLEEDNVKLCLNAGREILSF